MPDSIMGEEVGIDVLNLLLCKGLMLLRCPNAWPRRLTSGSSFPFPVSLTPKESCEVTEASCVQSDPVGSKQRCLILCPSFPF